MRAAPWLLGLSSVGVSLFAALSSADAQQQPSLESCNNIYVEAGAECMVIPPSASCDAVCTPINVEAACAAELQVQCDASCNAELDVGCTVDCSAGCTAECLVDPGEFDCQAYCQADCSGACEAECAAGAEGGECRAACRATCSADCNADCKITPPTATCEARCEASCKGSCHAKANIDCQADCQADGFVDCKARVTGGCEVDCMSQEGALFCDGYYVDTKDQLEMCVAALEAALDIEYMASAEGECVGNTCTATAEASAGCSALPGAAGGASSFGLIFAGMAAYAARRRRR